MFNVICKRPGGREEKVRSIGGEFKLFHHGADGRKNEEGIIAKEIPSLAELQNMRTLEVSLCYTVELPRIDQ